MKPKGRRPARVETWACIGAGLIMGLWALWMICSPVFAAVVNEPFKWDGDLQAVRIVTRVQNGSNFVPVDSFTHTVFPVDTTVTLNDTANWVVLIGALWTGETDTVWSTEKFQLKDPFPILNEMLDTLQNFDDWIAMQVSIDSVGYWLGYCPTCRTRKGRGGDIDTLHIMKGTGVEPDSLLHVLYWHIGGVTGNTPDSVTVL